MLKIPMPLFIMLPRKTKADKKVIINLNVYRNLHRMTESHVKKAYSEIAQSKLIGITLTYPIELKFTYYKPTARRSDRSNVLSIHEKYFCDALVAVGCIPDDADEYIKTTTYAGGQIDRENPRVEIEIIESM